MKRVTAALVAAATLLAGCGSHATRGSSPASPSSSASLSSPSSPPSSGDRAACAALYANLQRVTDALDSSSQLLATSQDKQQLSDRIAYEQGQLQQAAELMAHGPVPASLASANRDLVAALRAFTADFARARDPAARGDFQGAAAAMTDKPVVQRIVDASTKIEHACG